MLLVVLLLLGLRAVLVRMMLDSAAVAVTLSVAVGGLVRVASATVVIRRGVRLVVIGVGRAKGC